MTPQLWIGGVIAAIVTASVTYLVARRSTSGKINTSSAETLWAEADKLRSTYREESEKNRKESEHLRKEVQALREEVSKLREEGQAQRAEAEEQRREARALREELTLTKKKLEDAYQDLDSKRQRENGSNGE
jgi:chromosome segregation ATPase